MKAKLKYQNPGIVFRKNRLLLLILEQLSPLGKKKTTTTTNKIKERKFKIENANTRRYSPENVPFWYMQRKKRKRCKTRQIHVSVATQ